jgi:signal transduction histidine kinase
MIGPRSWLRLPPRTARLRLTLLYSGMFLALGTAVIAITYVLASGGPTVTVATAVHPAPTAPRRAIVIGGRQSPMNGARSDPLANVRSVISEQRTNDLSRLLAVSWVVLAITTIASALLGWFASGRVLRPLREMTATAETISAGNLDRRLALVGPDDEFKRLGDTFDDLLARLQSAFESQRRFVANASHELRTPLTLERALLQVTLADPDASAATLRAACEELLESGRDQERLLEALLTLTSSERGLDHREPLDLAKLADRVLRAGRPAIERRAINLVTALAPAPIAGDPHLIERLITNLIDNAVSYNVQGGRLEVATATDSGRSWLSVANTGSVVTSDQLGRMFEPFQRLNGGRAAPDGHHGLGLSIVRAIATAHDATVDARARPGGGLALTVSFAEARVDEQPSTEGQVSQPAADQG